MAEVLEELFDPFFVEEPGVIRAYPDLHNGMIIYFELVSTVVLTRITEPVDR